MELRESVKIFVMLLAISCINVVVANTNTKISKSVLTQLEEHQTVDIFVSFNGGKTVDLINEFSQNGVTHQNRQFRYKLTESLVVALETQAETTQREVMQNIKKSRNSAEISTTSFWITNQIFIRNASSELVQELTEHPDIAGIELNTIIQMDPWDPIPGTRKTMNEPTWAIDNIGANQVWNLSDGNAGEGIVIGIIDTGVRRSHATLRDNYHGKYGWFDPYEMTTTPNDQVGYGTHVAGTILGKNGIGVAPNATWIACKGCTSTSNNRAKCERFALIKCGEFFLCPTLPDGSRRDCSKVPHIASNSWASDYYDGDWFAPIVTAWHASGIIPVFSIGDNGGEGCGSAGSPGSLPNVIAVGATNMNNRIAAFSSRGPTYDFDDRYETNARIKPDISAPGVGIYSASHLSNEGTVVMDGTSMASPHISGAIALLKSAKPDLTFEQVKRYLFEGVDKDVIQYGDVCEGISDSEFPNNFYGHGKLNIHGSMLNLLRDMNHKDNEKTTPHYDGTTTKRSKQTTTTQKYNNGTTTKKSKHGNNSAGLKLNYFPFFLLLTGITLCFSL